MTPRQRAEAVIAKSAVPFLDKKWWLEAITAAIQAESNAELERGRKRTATVQAALQAALEDLAQVTRERDELAAALESTKKAAFDAMCSVADEQRAGAMFANPMLAVSARFVLTLNEIRDYSAILAAHDRAVAARVLDDVRRYVDDCSSDNISEIADEYRTGEREVPGE